MRTLRQRRAVSTVYGLAALLPCFLCGCGVMGGHVMNESGVAYYNRGDYAMARREFQQAVAVNPQNANYWHNLAAVMKKQGDFGGAESTWRQTLAFDATHQPSYHGLAELLAETGRDGDAMVMLESWAGTQPYSPEPHMELAWIRGKLGDSVGAEQSLKQAMQIDPGNPTAMAQLGELYEQTGQANMAVAMYQRSLHQQWDQPKVQAQLAQLTGNRYATGRPEQRFAARPTDYQQMPQQQMVAYGPPRDIWNGSRSVAQYRGPRSLGPNYRQAPGYGPGMRPQGMSAPNMMSYPSMQMTGMPGNLPQGAQVETTYGPVTYGPTYEIRNTPTGRQMVLMDVNDPLTPAPSSSAPSSLARSSLAPHPQLTFLPQPSQTVRSSVVGHEQVVPAAASSAVPGPVLYIPTTETATTQNSETPNTNLDADMGIPVTSAF